jgi:hypothetical protein
MCALIFHQMVMMMAKIITMTGATVNIKNQEGIPMR